MLPEVNGQKKREGAMNIDRNTRDGAVKELALYLASKEKSGVFRHLSIALYDDQRK